MAPLRLADLLASVSLVADLGFALPPEASMRSSIVATALGRRIGLDEASVSDAFYTALIQHVGCTGFAHESAAIYGDEMTLNAALSTMDPDHLRDVVDNFIRPMLRGRSPLDGARVALFTIVSGDRFGRRFATATCEVGRETARRLGLPDGVRRGLHEAVESWNGKAGARGLRGDEISLPARIASLAATVAHFHEIGGEDAVVASVRRSAGGVLDPSLVATFLEHRVEILGQLRAGDPRDVLLDAEPEPVRSVPEAGLAAVAGAVGDIADLKSPFMLGHSGGVAALAAQAAASMGLDPAACLRINVAALLHDVGRVGISSAVWERPGPLTSAQWEQVRLHPYHSERILARSEGLRPMAALARMHHERIDGSGYHRGARGREVGPEARILAAADAFQAMTQDRAHRPALGPARAAEQLQHEARAGRLDGEAVSAVVAAAGMRGRRRAARAARPAGLSDREVEVLRLVARGMSNRDIAGHLVVSPRTAEHHVQHIYTKIGASSRAAAALFAMEHDLLA